MKIIQLNIWGGKFGQQIINFLKAEQPDFVCMQEVNDLKGNAGYKFFATLDDIKKESGFSQAFMSANYSSRYMERSLEYGNAILSKLPFIAKDTIYTNGKYKTNFDIESDDGNIRNLQVSKIEINGKTLNILNHHGYHLGLNKLGDKETIRQMTMIAETIDSLEGPIILCGDFNLSPASESIKIIDSKLTNLSVANNLKRTYNQFSIVDEVCDYIFINDQVKPISFKMSEELLSDHKALILEFSL